MRRGRGFVYLDAEGGRLTNEQTFERIRSLAIPPAWTDVWICPDPLGHLQATGIDAAGRKQYLYHPLWRERRDRAKFERMLRFARALPRLRRRLTADLDRAEPTRERVLAGAVRLLDIGLFRIGSEEYAENGGGLGLTTIRKEHVAFENGWALFDYPAKGGIRRVQQIDDPGAVELVRALKRRRGGPPELLAYRNGRGWVAVRSDDVNDYLKRQLGEDFSAKDFRTWNATVLAAVAVTIDGSDATTKTARQRVVKGAVRAVAEILGNTPAVARRAYIDPRVFDRYLSGWTIAGAVEKVGNLETIDERGRRQLERAVLDLLAGDHGSPAVERVGS
jgi:DNA topoisomerase I